ncbi:hypothetical protein ACFPFX_25925, partial [Streptomyces mauvecolor]
MNDFQDAHVVRGGVPWPPPNSPRSARSFPPSVPTPRSYLVTSSPTTAELIRYNRDQLDAIR